MLTRVYHLVDETSKTMFGMMCCRSKTCVADEEGRTEGMRSSDKCVGEALIRSTECQGGEGGAGGSQTLIYAK